MFFGARNLQNRQKVVPLYCVFYIRFKVNKGLGLSGAPFFMSFREDDMEDAVKK